MNRIITYAINKDDGIVWSRVGSEVAVPVLDFAKIGENGDFTGPMEYNLEKFPVVSIGREWARLKWTKKIPLSLKNKHREFWGMKPLKTHSAWDAEEVENDSRFAFLEKEGPIDPRLDPFLEKE